MKKAIVTGATGFIGRNLVPNLLSNGIEVYAIVLDTEKAKQMLPSSDRLKIISGQPYEDSILSELTSGADVMFHLAWNAVSGPSRADYGVQLDNVRLACDYVVLASKIGCKRFVYASSINEMETYEYLQSDGINPGGGYIYGTGKLAAHLMGETVAHLNGVDFIPVIITNIYGAGEKSARLINTSIRQLLNKEHCSFTEGRQTYDFIYVTDAIASIAAVAEKGKPFNRYYIGSGEPKPLREFLLEMRDVVDPSAVLGLGDLPFNGTDIDYSQFSLKKVREDTGYENKISFREGIRMTMDFIKSEKSGQGIEE